MPVFWIDTSVFIEAKNRAYPYERVPQFWKFLAQQFKAGSICCPKKVYGELASGNDWLADWVKSRKADGICVTPPDKAQGYMSKIVDHVWETYPRRRAEEFLGGADPWVIAYALCDGGTVVTEESASRKKKVPIPLVCKHFTVRPIDTYKMLDELRAKFG